ncbi:tumor necrosis factor receptor superfamily member 8 [Thomomys bottae]
MVWERNAARSHSSVGWWRWSWGLRTPGTPGAPPPVGAGRLFPPQWGAGVGPAPGSVAGRLALGTSGLRTCSPPPRGRRERGAAGGPPLCGDFTAAGRRRGGSAARARSARHVGAGRRPCPASVPLEMPALSPAVPLLLLGTLQALPQEQPLKTTCAGNPSFYYDQALGQCCYRCPSGWSSTKSCPQSADCRKQCEPDYYLNEAGRCTACVSCLRDDLVEKAPCSGNSSRICECRPGMFCLTSAANSCARCWPHSVCSAGMVVQFPGTAEKDTVCQQPPSLPDPSDTSPQHYKTPTSTAATLSPLLDSKTSRTVFLPSTRKPILDPGPVLFWVVTVLLVALGSGFLLLCHRRACRRRIGQKLHLCFPAQTFRPKLELVALKQRGNSLGAREMNKGGLPSLEAREELGFPASVSTPYPQESRILVAEPGPGSLSAPGPPPVELSTPVGAVCPESLPLLDTSLVEGPSVPRDPPEPRVSTEHTNNRIEKIYIMKADTVIVGTVKTEVPESRGLGGPGEPELEAELEVDHVPHYPEQETEPPLGSCEDVMFSVEEEGREDSWPMTASGK